MAWPVNCGHTVNLCKWASWSEWVIAYFLALALMTSSRFYSPLLSLNLHITRGIFSERAEAERRSVAFFLWSRIMAREEQTRRMKAPSVNSEQFWATFSKSSEPKR